MRKVEIHAPVVDIMAEDTQVLSYKITHDLHDQSHSIQWPSSLQYTISHYDGSLRLGGEAALLALLLPAMQKGIDLVIHTPVSARLLYFCKNDVQEILINHIPGLKRIAIDAPEYSYNGDLSTSEVVTGFSGGIDSYCVLSDYLFSCTPAGFKVNRLLFNNVGSHGIDPVASKDLFCRRYEKLAKIALKMGLKITKINSNLDEFYGSSLGFPKSHSLVSPP